MTKIKYLTINTDASYLPLRKSAGYAFYIVCNLFKITKGGKFKAFPQNSSVAELMCIGNAIATLLAQKELPEIENIVINTDSTISISALQAIETPAKYPSTAIVKNLLFELGNRTGAQIKFKHVKAHTNDDSPRSLANAWCDQEARKWAKKKDLVDVPIKATKV